LADQLLNGVGALDRSVSSQFKRLVFSDIIEMNVSESEITEAYLARAYFGNMATGLGCAAMARYKKQVKDLTLAQFAMLIGLLKAPTAYEPLRHPEAAMKRRNEVLDIWLVNGIATEADVDRAKQEPLL
jgi:membrane carboxypeptidase/penicillin-binding protein